MGKYTNTLEELRDTRNFAKLATVYRYLAKFRDGIAAAAPKVPNGALDPTLKHLDKTLQDYRDLASQITGYQVQDGDLRINLGDEFGAAETPTTEQHATSDASKIDVVRELAAAQPFDEAALTPWDLNSITVGLRDPGTLYGTGPGGALTFVTRNDMTSAEGRYTWDAFASLESLPIVQEARGCVNRMMLSIAAAGGVVAIAIVAFAVWASGGGDDDDDGVVIGDTPGASETSRPGCSTRSRTRRRAILRSSSSRRRSIWTWSTSSTTR